MERILRQDKNGEYERHDSFESYICHQRVYVFGERDGQFDSVQLSDDVENDHNRRDDHDGGNDDHDYDDHNDYAGNRGFDRDDANYDKF